MKVLISLLILSFCGCAYTKKDKQLLSAMWVVSIADYYQTNRILEDDGFNEQNGMIKDDTDAGAVLLGVPVALTLSYKCIPAKHRPAIIKAFVGVKGVAIFHNYKEGVR